MTDQQSERSLIESLSRVRTDASIHWIAMFVAIAVGLLLSTLSWLGLVAGGALVGLVATSLKRAVLAGIGFGVLAVLVWAFLFAVSGVFGHVFSMGVFAVIPVGIALGAAVLGSLVRGVV